MNKKRLIDTFPTFDDHLQECLKDPEHFQGYLEECFKEYLNDGNKEAFIHCIKPLIKSQGTIKAFADKSGMNRTYIYKIFNNTVNPNFETLTKIINALGFEFSINIKKAS